ncbi:MAG TPA: DUF2339 domain-containing protein [Beijerinckiaceae bacterium]|nr:DUF2339 domain-containing protein [Beijerinckiaceae bacterium]
MFETLGLVIFLLVVAGPVGFFLAIGARERVARLENRLAALEREIAKFGPRTQPAPSAFEPMAAPVPPAPAYGVAPPFVPAETQMPPMQPAEAVPDRLQSPAPETHEETRVESNPVVHVSLEERLGARWSVWVGGAAVALGAVFLVRYSIEQGLFGPAVRIGFGALLAVALIAAGEILRRRDPSLPPIARAEAAQPYIPGILTAAGTIAAFATIYAAHALYHFIGPAPAFVLLGMIGLATMVAAALHGPGLAALGLVGAFITPLLVVSNTPNAGALVIYLIVISTSAYALARLRNWLWLALSTATGGWLWALALAVHVGSAGSTDRIAILAHEVIQLALACFIFAFDRHSVVADENASRQDGLAIALPAAFALIGLLTLQALAPTMNSAWIIVAGLNIALLALTGVLAAPAAGTSAIGTLVFLACLVIWPKSTSEGRDLLYFFLPGDPPSSPRSFATFAFVGSLALGVLSGRRLFIGEKLRLGTAAIYAGCATLAPLGALVLAYLRMTRGEASVPLAAVGAGVAVAFAVAAEVFRGALENEQHDATALGVGAFASAALAALALSFVFSLSGGTLTVALALSALGAAFVSYRLAISALRWCVAALALVIALRLAYDPRVVGTALGTTPIFNWLLIGYGVPALSFGLASVILGAGPTRQDDIPRRCAEALAVLFSAFLVFFEIRHAINGGDPFAATSDLIEEGLFTISSFGFTLVLTRLDEFAGSTILRIASFCFGLTGLALSTFALLFAVNPLFTARNLEGGAFFNALLLGYVGPAILAALAARQARDRRPRWYIAGLRIAATALAFTYISLEVRRLFQGPTIGLDNPASNAEWYSYSAVWLALGIMLLAYGLWRRAQDLRVTSAVFVMASVLKVFLFDLAWVEGILRALSFIGLGLVLIGIGLVYQKLIFAHTAAPKSTST